MLLGSIILKVSLENTELSATYTVVLDSNTGSDIPNGLTLTITSASYNRSSQAITVYLELWTPTFFSYFGKVHPFVIEIIGSYDFTIINNQCFCSKEHYFLNGYSSHKTYGWLATNESPPILLPFDYLLLDTITIGVHLENILFSDPYDLILN